MAAEQLVNLYQDTVGGGGYTAGSGVLTVSSGSGAPPTGPFTITVLDSGGTSILLLFRVASIVGGVAFHGAAEGADVNAPAGSIVIGSSLSVAAIQNLFAASGGSPIRFVQSNGTNVDSPGASTTLAFEVNCVSGDLIVVMAGWQTSTGSDPTVTDSLLTVYSVAESIHSNSNSSVAILCGVAPSSGANTITVTWPASTQYATVIIAEFGGVTTTTDGAASAYNPAHFNSVSATSAANGDLLLFATNSSAGGPSYQFVGCLQAGLFQAGGGISGGLGFVIQNAAGLFTNGLYVGSGNLAVAIVALAAA